MQFIKERNGNTLVIRIKGSLNAVNAPELLDMVKESLDGIDELIFDVSEMDYISSAGLRVFLVASQIMDEKGGEIKVDVANELVMEIFQETGFANILNISVAEKNE